MDLAYLKYFYEVAKAGSFSSAARMLRVSQPSLSKSVALLEARENVRLLRRSKLGVELTDTGKKIFSLCEEIFQRVESAENICKGDQNQIQGPLRIGASDHIAAYLLPDQTLQLLAQYPNIEPVVISASPYDLCTKLEKREIEVALFFLKIASPILKYDMLARVSQAAVISPKCATNTEYYPYIGSPRNDIRKKPSDFLKKKSKIALKYYLESNSQEVQKKFCVAGAGLGIFARFMVEEELSAGQLKELNSLEPIEAPLWIVTRKGAHLSPPASAFIKQLKEKLFNGPLHKK